MFYLRYRTTDRHPQQCNQKHSDLLIPFGGTPDRVSGDPQNAPADTMRIRPQPHAREMPTGSTAVFRQGQSRCLRY